MKKLIPAILPIVLALALCLLSTGSKAQKISLSGFWGGWKNAAYFMDKNAVFTGGYGAVEFNHNFLVGWQGFRHFTKFRFEEEKAELTFNYQGFLLAYAPWSNKKLHGYVEFMPGFGKIKKTYPLYFIEDTRVFILQPQLGLEYNVSYWFRLGLKGGYRWTLGVDPLVVEPKYFQSAFVELDLKFGIKL